MLNDSMLLLSVATWLTTVVGDHITGVCVQISRILLSGLKSSATQMPTDVKSIKGKLQQTECAKETYNRVVRENLGYCYVILEIQ